MFADGTFAKPVVKESEFFVGGYYAMTKRLKRALVPFAGAFDEYETRTAAMEINGAVGTMWEYIELELHT